MNWTDALCSAIHSTLRVPRRFFVGQVVNLRPIGNRPAGSAQNALSNVSDACGLQRCGQVGNRPPSSTMKTNISASSMVWRPTGVTEDFRRAEEADCQSAAG